jgi:hypothetical protein
MKTEQPFPTKQLFKQALFSERPLPVVEDDQETYDGELTVSGPALLSRKWYARVEVRDGMIVRLIS